MEEYWPFTWRSDSVRFKYSYRVDTGHRLTFPGNVGKNISKVLPGLAVLRRSYMINFMASCTITLLFKSNRLNVNALRLRSCNGPCDDK